MRANLLLRNSTLAMSASTLLGSAGTNGEMLAEAAAALQIAEANEKMMTAIMDRITRGSRFSIFNYVEIINEQLTMKMYFT